MSSTRFECLSSRTQIPLPQFNLFTPLRNYHINISFLLFIKLHILPFWVTIIKKRVHSIWHLILEQQYSARQFHHRFLFSSSPMNQTHHLFQSFTPIYCTIFTQLHVNFNNQTPKTPHQTPSHSPLYLPLHTQPFKP